MLFSRSVRACALALIFCSLPALDHAETLREALTSAYVNNPSILSALLNVKSTAENIALAKSAKLPNIGASISSNSSYTFDGTAQDLTPSVNVGLSYNQTIFDNYVTNGGTNGLELLSAIITQQILGAANKIGYGSAIGVVLLVISLVPITYFLFMQFRK